MNGRYNKSEVSQSQFIGHQVETIPVPPRETVGDEGLKELIESGQQLAEAATQLYGDSPSDDLQHKSDQVWNAISVKIRSSSSFVSFKRSLKSHLFPSISRPIMFPT